MFLAKQCNMLVIYRGCANKQPTCSVVLSSVGCGCFFCTCRTNPGQIMWLSLFLYPPVVADVKILNSIYYSILIEYNSSCLWDLIRFGVFFVVQLMYYLPFINNSTVCCRCDFDVTVNCVLCTKSESVHSSSSQLLRNTFSLLMPQQRTFKFSIISDCNLGPSIEL